MFDRKEIYFALKSVGCTKPTIKNMKVEFWETLGDDKTVDRLLVHLSSCKTIYADKINNEYLALFDLSDNLVGNILLYTAPINGFICYRLSWK